MQTIPYLTFSGNCHEAMTFYKKCLGGTLVFQTVGESALAEKMPARMKKLILQAKLVKGTLVLMASDMVGESGLTKGNAVSVFLHCDNERALRSIYKKLTKGGEEQYPPESKFNKTIMAALKDKYDNSWLLYCNEAKA